MMCRLLAICILLILSGCKKEPPPLDWPPFPDEVIRAGRAPANQSSSVADEAQATSPEEHATEEPIPATREAILDQLKHTEYGKAIKNIERLGAKAVGPLLEIIADDSIPLRYRDRVVTMAIRLGTEDELQPQVYSEPTPIELRPLTKDAGRITDAVLKYLRDNPAAHEARSLEEITPLDRLPNIINLIVASSESSQAGYIRTFCTLTHTQFPTIPSGFCGNSTSESIERAMKKGAKAQEESVDAIKRWWLENGKKPYAHWAIDGARRRIQMEATERAQYLQTLTEYESEQQQRDYFIRRYNARGRFGPSAYNALVDEFNKADAVVTPYILSLIAATRHEGAAAFAADRLSSSDPNLQHAAVEGLRILGAVEYADGIKRMLRTAEDKMLIGDTIQALHHLLGADAIDAAVDWLNDDWVSQQALSAIKPYLTTHADRLREIAASHRDKNIAKTLRSLLDRSSVREAIPKTIGAELLSDDKAGEIKRLLRSSDAEKQRAGIVMVSKHELAELVPEVMELLRSKDRDVRTSAVGAIVQLGVPALTMERAPRLMGHSLKLDRHIAAYCYAKYGREALPLVRKTALQWRDPDTPSVVASPAVGLIKALVDEKVEGIEDDIVEMINEIPNAYSHVSLLALLEDAKSAAAVGEMLRSKSDYSRMRLIRVASQRKLVEHADVLFDLAMSVPDDEVLQRIQDEYNEGKRSYKDYQRVREDHTNRPANALSATRALLVFGDPRAWRAAVQCFEGGELNWHENSGLMNGPNLATAFGEYLALRKREYQREIHDLLRNDLAGDNQDWLQLTLATALVIDPHPSDSDVLWQVASNSTAGAHARVLCAVALSKLDEERVIPVLQELLQPTLSALLTDGKARVAMPYFSMLSNPLSWPLPQRRVNLLSWELAYRREALALTPDHINVARALRRLGDETLVEAAQHSLIDERGSFDDVAFHALMDLAGTKGHRLAHDWIEQHDPELTLGLDFRLALRLEPGVLSLESLRKLPNFGSILVARLPAIVAGQLTEAADAMAAAFDKQVNRYFATQILDALSQLGDIRGLELASADAALLSSLGRYLPDAPHVDFPPQAFKYNRVEDGLALQQWYADHKQELRWDPAAKQFQLAAASE